MNNKHMKQFAKKFSQSCKKGNLYLFRSKGAYNENYQSKFDKSEIRSERRNCVES